MLWGHASADFNQMNIYEVRLLDAVGAITLSGKPLNGSSPSSGGEAAFAAVDRNVATRFASKNSVAVRYWGIDLQATTSFTQLIL
jgi:hypothetical protein